MILILAAAAASPSPAPAATPAPSASDPCGVLHTNLLAALDRPTIGFSSCAVKPGDRLFEIGYANRTSAEQHVATYPQGFFRIGVLPNVEIDAIGPGFAAQDVGGQIRRGVLDSGFGAKIEYWHNAQDALAVDLLYTAATGDLAFSSRAPVETVNFDGAHALSPAVGLSATLGVQSAYGQSLSGSWGRFGTLLPSLVVTDQINDRTQFYAETYGQTRLRPDGGSLFGLDGGIQYLLKPSIEIDVEVGRTVTDIERAPYVGFGFGLRF